MDAWLAYILYIKNQIPSSIRLIFNTTDTYERNAIIAGIPINNEFLGLRALLKGGGKGMVGEWFGMEKACLSRGGRRTRGKER